MCKICENNEELNTSIRVLKLKIHGNHLGIYYDAYSCDSDIYEDNLLDINYCPICGKRLK